jgi:hypothetical protein
MDFREALAIDQEAGFCASVKLLRFVEPRPRRNIGLAWRSTSSRKADFLEPGGAS